MTSQKYPTWDIAEITEAGGPREFVMVNVDVPLWVLVREYRPNQFAALVYHGGKLVKRFARVADACAFAEF